MARLRTLLFVLTGLFDGFVAPGVVHAASYTYDGPPLARVEVVVAPTAGSALSQADAAAPGSVVRYMQKADAEAAGNQTRFLELFEQYVKDPVRRNPDLLRKCGWS